jgi:hypothetical protein
MSPQWSTATSCMGKREKKSPNEVIGIKLSLLIWVIIEMLNYKLFILISFCLLVCFSNTEGWTQGFRFAKQVVCHLSHLASLFALVIGWQAHTTIHSHWFRWGSHKHFCPASAKILQISVLQVSRITDLNHHSHLIEFLSKKCFEWKRKLRYFSSNCSNIF